MRRRKMTPQETNGERGQSEETQIVGQRFEQIRSENSRKHLMAAVSSASVIITNPAHYAVALPFESGKMDAPVCVAKNIDHIALETRETAVAPIIGFVMRLKGKVVSARTGHHQ